MRDSHVLVLTAIHVLVLLPSLFLTFTRFQSRLAVTLSEILQVYVIPKHKIFDQKLKICLI